MKKTALLLALLMGPASAPMRLDADARGNDSCGDLQSGNQIFVGGNRGFYSERFS